jgi:peptidoglycan/LPS O-acetylase OafA/YrhL
MELRAESAAASRPGKLHLAHIEGLRALAALSVYVNHAYAQTWLEVYGEHATGILSVFRISMVTGHLAVTVFIVISGFCLTLPVVDGGTRIRGGAREFFKRRARRILPPYYSAVLLCLALIATIIGKPTGTLWDVPIQVDRLALICHFALLQDFFRTGAINYAFWSIATEWHIYLLFPLLVAGTRRYGIARVAIVALIFGYAVRLGFTADRVHRANPQYLGLFALGMVAAYVTRSKEAHFSRARARSGWGVLAGILLVGTLALVQHWGIFAATPRFPYLDFPIGIMTMAILVHTTTDQSRRLTRFLSFKPLVFVGTFSYSVYLIHAPFLQILWQYVLRPLGMTKSAMFVSFMTFGLAFVLLAAYVFFRFCEQPFMRTPGAPQPKPTPETSPS